MDSIWFQPGLFSAITLPILREPSRAQGCVCAVPHPWITALLTDKILVLLQQKGKWGQTAAAAFPGAAFTPWASTNSGTSHTQSVCPQQLVPQQLVPQHHSASEARTDTSLAVNVLSHHLHLYQSSWPLALGTCPPCLGEDPGIPKPKNSLKNLLGHCYVMLVSNR